MADKPKNSQLATTVVILGHLSVGVVTAYRLALSAQQRRGYSLVKTANANGVLVRRTHPMGYFRDRVETGAPRSNKQDGVSEI